MARKPNLLFIFTDEQRADTLACYGNDLIQTPNLNALAAESFVFESAYCTQPLCTPARASILTGLHPHSHRCTGNNVSLRPDIPTLAEMAPDDYVCAYYGKWHLGDEIIPQRGFSEWLSIEDAYRPYYTQEAYRARFSDYYHFLVANGFVPDGERAGGRVFTRPTAANLPEPYTKAAFLGHEAARFIREHAGRPYIFFVNFLEPHMPFTGPFNDLYPPATLPVGPHFLQKPPANASFYHRRMADYHTSQPVFQGINPLGTEANWRKLRAQYWGLVTLVDRAVGQILQALADTGQADHTAVIFTSDHGDMMGDHALLAKSVLYEEAVKIPLLARVPWLAREQRRIAGRVSQIDLVPTLLDLLGQPQPDHLEGRSRLPVLEGRETLAANDVFIEWAGKDDLPEALAATLPDDEKALLKAPWRMIISADGWKLNLSNVDQCELYDLNTDPHEMVNRYDDPAQRARVRDLTERLRAWQRRTQDTTPLPVV